LTAEEKVTEFQLAKARAKALRLVFLQRKATMAEERCVRLKNVKEEAVRQRMLAVTVRSDLTKQVTKYGLWTNEIEVDVALNVLPTRAAKVKALVSQLKFRKTVLKQPGDRSLFAFSQKGKNYSWEQLRTNLMYLIDAAMLIVPTADSFQIIGKRTTKTVSFLSTVPGARNCRAHSEAAVSTRHRKEAIAQNGQSQDCSSPRSHSHRSPSPPGRISAGHFITRSSGLRR
jgi:hypothetical protein